MSEKWHKVARRSELEEDYPSRVKVGTRELAISLVDGTVFATDNICSHAFARLSDGHTEGFELVCPLHGGSFDVRTGKAIRDPCDQPIAVYECRVENEDVLVMVQDDEPPGSGNDGSQSAVNPGAEQHDSMTREQMIARGAYGFLSRAYECVIPIERVRMLLPDPVCEEWGAYRHGDEQQPIEVKYSAEEDAFLLFAGNLKLKEATDRGERYIRAFVEMEADQIRDALREKSSRRR